MVMGSLFAAPGDQNNYSADELAALQAAQNPEAQTPTDPFAPQQQDILQSYQPVLDAAQPAIQTAQALLPGGVIATDAQNARDAQAQAQQEAQGQRDAQAVQTLAGLQGQGFLGSQNVPGLLGGAFSGGMDILHHTGAVPFGGQQFIENTVKPAVSQGLQAVAPYLNPVAGLIPGPTQFAANQIAGLIPSSAGDALLLGMGGENRAFADATGQGLRDAFAQRVGIPDNIIQFPRAPYGPEFQAGNPRDIFSRATAMTDGMDALKQPGGGSLEEQLTRSLAGERPANTLGITTRAEQNAAAASRPLPIEDPDKHAISQLWAKDQPNPDPASLSLQDKRSGLYNAGLNSNGTASQIETRYASAEARGIKLPQDEPPSAMPDARDLATEGKLPQSPLNEPGVTGGGAASHPAAEAPPIDTGAAASPPPAIPGAEPRALSDAEWKAAGGTIPPGSERTAPPVGPYETGPIPSVKPNASVQEVQDLIDQIQGAQNFKAQGAAGPGVDLSRPGATGGGPLPPNGRTGLAPLQPNPPNPYVQAGKSVLKEINGITGLFTTLKVWEHIPLLRQALMTLGANPRAGLLGFDAEARSLISEGHAALIRDAVSQNAKTTPEMRFGQPTNNTLQSPHLGASGTALPRGLTMEEAGLREARWGDNVPTGSRESFMEGRGSGDTLGSKLINNTPIVGQGARATERAYANGMNVARQERYWTTAEELYKRGAPDREYRQLAQVINHQTGFGPIGQGPLSIFFSMRAVSGRGATAADLFTKVGNPFRPGAYQEVVKGLLGQGLASTVLTGAAVAAGGVISRNQYGLPSVNWANDLGSQILDPNSGYNAITKLAVGSIADIYQNRDSPRDAINDLKDRYIQFARGELGPLQGKLVDVLTGKDFSGAKLAGANVGERALNLAKSPDAWINATAPFWAEAMYNGYRNMGIEGAIRGSPSLLAASIQNYDRNPASQRTYDANQVLQDPQRLQAAFPQNPEMAPILAGKTHSDLDFKESQAIQRSLPADQQKVIAQAEQQLRDANDAFQKSRDIEALASKNVEQIKAQFQPIIDKIGQDKSIPPGVRIAALGKAKAEMDAQIQPNYRAAAIYHDSQEYKDAVAKAQANQAGSGQAPRDSHYFDIKAAYGTLYDQPANKMADGKENWDNFYKSEAQFWIALQQSEPDIAARLAYNLAK